MAITGTVFFFNTYHTIHISSHACRRFSRSFDRLECPLMLSVCSVCVMGRTLCVYFRPPNRTGVGRKLMAIVFVCELRIGFPIRALLHIITSTAHSAAMLFYISDVDTMGGGIDRFTLQQRRYDMEIRIETT